MSSNFPANAISSRRMLDPPYPPTATPENTPEVPSASPPLIMLRQCANHVLTGWLRPLNPLYSGAAVIPAPTARIGSAITDAWRLTRTLHFALSVPSEFTVAGRRRSVIYRRRNTFGSAGNPQNRECLRSNGTRPDTLCSQLTSKSGHTGSQFRMLAGCQRYTGHPYGRELPNLRTR